MQSNIDPDLRRLPVYLVLDCSGSMSGAPIEAVKEAVTVLLKDLREEPWSQEIVWVSIITFNSTAEQIIPLTEITKMPEVNLTATGMTALGLALKELMKCLDKDIRIKTEQHRGDYKPIVYLLTDGQPTDDGDWQLAAKELKKYKIGSFVACAAGPDADEKILKSVTDIVVRLQDASPESLRAFIRWVSQSILVKSRSVKLSKITDEEPSLPKGTVFFEDEVGHPLAPTQRIDQVHFSVSSQPAIRRGQQIIVDISAHLERQRAEVILRLQQASAQTDLPHNIRSTGPFDVKRGARLFVRLKFPDLLIDEPEDVLLWKGEIASAYFVVSAPVDISEGMRTGLVTVYLEGGFQVARIPLQLLVVSKEVSTTKETNTILQIQKAFASYASEDTNEVLGRIQGMQKMAPNLEVFLDRKDLRSGVDWEQTLKKVIPENDVMYLFWSAAAKASPWVEMEWRCALDSRGIEFIDPVPLVSPEEVSPPEELSNKHFNDWILAYKRFPKT